MGMSLFPEPQGKPATPAGGMVVPGERQESSAIDAGAPPKPLDGVTSLFPSGSPDDSRRLKQAVRLGSQVPASNAGRTLALNRKMGMPLAVIERNLPAVEAQAAQRDLDADEFRGVYPVAAQWMAEHPLHAAVGVPDLKQMSAIEAAATALKMGFQSGRKQAQASTAMFDAMESGRQLHPMERHLLEQGMVRASGQPSRANFLEDVLFFGSQFAGQMSTAVPDVAEGAGKGFMGAAIGAIGATLAGVSAPITIGAGIAVGATYGLAKSVFKQEAGAAYDGLSQIEGTAGETIDEPTKRAAAYGVGALNAAIEVALDVSVLGAPFKQLAKKFAQDATSDLLVRPTMRQAMSTFGKHYVGALIAEPTQEVAQEMTNLVAEEVAKMVTNGNFATLMNDPAQREEAMQRLADIAEQTAKGTLLIGLPGPSINLGSDIVRARNATKRVNAYVALGKAMEAASPALIESGGAATVAERTVGQGANFYIDVQSFTEYFQSQGVDPRIAAREIWGDTRAYDEAVQGNSSLELPVRTYAEKVAATKANEFFAKEIRRAPDEMNGRESEAFLQAAQEMLAERAKEAAEPANSERTALTERIAAQLVATQQYREQDAKDMAQQMAHFFTAMASQLPGTTPAQLAERYPLTVSRGERPVEKEVKARRDRAKSAGAAAEAQAKVLGDVTTQLEAQAVSQDPAVAETAKGRLAFLNTITPSFSDEEEAARLTEEEGEARAANRARPRTPGGTLKNLTKSTVEELFNEYQILTDANAVENVATTSLQTDYNETWTGYKSGAIKALGRIAARNKTIAKLEAEFARRGIDPAEAYMQGYSALINSQPEGFSFEQRAGAIPRGKLRVGNNEFNIQLLEGANLTTFLHESGHFYLEVYRDLAKSSPAIAAEWEKIKKYLGIEGDAAITTEQHETWARSTEAYFLEGKAPSMELRRIFHRFRTWLMSWYKVLTGGGVLIDGETIKLTAEVRGVFDRMFATDQEIQAAEREAELVPIFTTAEEADMSPGEFANYQQTVEDAHIAATDKVRTKVLRQFMRERDEWWKEARADMRQQVETEVNARPVYVALDVLRKGLYPDGTVVENQPRLNKAEIVALKGEAFLKRLGQRIYQAADGMSLEQASEQFGFTSGDEMLQAFVDAPNRKQVIESETDVRMKAKYGDMVSDGTLADEAEAAVQNEHQSDIVHAEMRALRRLANKVKPFVKQAESEGEAALAAEQKERDYERRWLEAEHKLATAIAVGRKQAEVDALQEEAKAAKAETAAGRRAFNAGIPDIAFVRQVARERIATQRVRDIRPMVYWVAARKAARAAIAAAGKQDFVEALNQKQHELLNQELYRAALGALEQADADKDYANRLQTTAKQQRLGKAGGGYLEQINAILERFDFRIRTNVAADRRLSLLRFIEEQKAKDIPIDIPVDIQDGAYQKPWREMTVEELRGVVDTLRHLDHLATFKNKLLKDAAKRSLEEAQGQAAASIAEHARKTLPAKAESNLPQDAAGKRIQAFIAAHRKLASYLRQMDGFVDGGVLQQMIMRQLNEADAALSEFNADATKRLADIFEKHYTKAELVKLYKKTYQKGLKDSLSKMGVLMMALNWGTEDNQQKLVAGLGLTYKRQISETDVGAVLNTLDKRDWAFVQDVWEMIGSYWPQIESLAKRLDGIAPQKIDGVPIQTRFGLVQGAYFPISYDKTQSTIRHHDAVAVSADEVRRGATAKRSTKAGARNERVAGVKSPLRLDFGVIREHLADLAQDITHTETLIDVGRILTGDEVKSAIRDHYGDVVYKQIMSSLDAIAAGDVPAQDGWDSAANFIRTGATVAGLGWNLTTSFLQPLGLSNAMARVGVKWVGLALKEWLGDAVHMQNTAKWIVEKSEMMKYRTTTQMRETAELMHAIGMDRSFTESLIDLGMDRATAGTIDLADLKQSYFWFITRMQLVADIPTWLGAYRKALAAMPLNEVDDAKAVSIADQAVLDAQSGGAIKDLASVQRGGSFRKIFTAFYSYMNLVLNQNAEAFARLNLSKPSSVGRFASDMLLINLIPVTVGFFLKRAVRGHGDDDDEIPEKLLREYASYVTGMFVGLRELSGVIQGFAGYEGPAGARFYAEVAKLMQQAGQGEADAAFLKALNGAAGVIFHYPAGQVQRTVQGFNALMQDRTNNPLALLFGPPQR